MLLNDYSYIIVVNGNGMYHIFCAIDDAGGDTFPFPKKSLLSVRQGLIHKVHYAVKIFPYNL